MSDVTGGGRIGTGTVEIGEDGRIRSLRRGRAALPAAAGVCAFFTPSEQPVITVWPSFCTHARCAARWALTALGLGHVGGELRVLWNGGQPGGSPLSVPAAESVAAVSAVDDAVAGGHRSPASGVRPPRLDDRLLLDPEELRRLAIAVGLDPACFRTRC